MTKPAVGLPDPEKPVNATPAINGDEPLSKEKDIPHNPNHPLLNPSDKPFTGDVLAHTEFEKTTWDFHWKNDEEPHAIRRKKILKDHPEIKRLFGTEPLTAVLSIGITIANFYVMTIAVESPTWLYCLLLYGFCATVSGTLQLLNHDLSHNLCSGITEVDMALGIICNLTTGIPSAITFRYYHYDHHLQQGVDGVDTDIPTQFEINLFRNPLTKLLWVVLMPAFYALRPLAIKPKKMTVAQIVNGVVQIGFDLWVLKTYGFWGLWYFLGGAIAGIAFHPCAGHFIAEHFEFMRGVETYSYYGSANFFNIMVGYHNEHHDFPKVPWSRLHRVNQIAKEYYQHLPHHTSYLRMYWTFLTDPSVGPWSRVKRHEKKKR